MQNQRARIAVLDDWQGVAGQSADWTKLLQLADVVFFEEPFAAQDKLAKALADFDIIIAMRERTKFSKELLERLPKLRMIALTGGRTWTMDFDTLNARGIPVCHTGGEKSGAATGATREDGASEPSYFSRKSRESRANNEIRFTLQRCREGCMGKDVPGSSG